MGYQQEQRRGRGPAGVGAALAAIVLVAIVVWIVAGLFWGSDGVLVVTDGPTAGLEEDERVLVRGTVGRFTYDQGLGADEALFDDFVDVPALYSDQVDPLLNDEADVEETAGVSVEEIAEEDTSFEGRRVTVTGEVGEVIGPRSFVLEED